MSVAYSIFGFILAIAILVTVHEYGHFQVARKLGVKVLKFSIGFGKPIYKWRRKNDPTEYCIGAIPLGGYVKMLDEAEGEVAAEEAAQAFNRQSLAVRSAIVVAGPAYNFLFAIFAMWLVFVIGSDDVAPTVGVVTEDSPAAAAGFQPGDILTAIDDREVRTWGQHQFYLLHQAMKGNASEFVVTDAADNRRTLRVDFAAMEQYAIGSQAITSQIGLLPPAPPATVARLVAGGAAADAGLQIGDLILAIDDTEIGDFNDLARYVSERPGKPATIIIRRDESEITIPLTIGTVTLNDTEYGRIGLYRPPLAGAKLRYGLLAAIPASLDYNWRMTNITIRSIGRMLRAQMSADNLSGPITIARLAGRTVESGYDAFLKFLAIISISLGLINLLPIPLLDGGHLLYFAIEAIKGSPPSQKIMLRGQQIGIALLVLLMSLAFYNDIMRLF